MLKIEAKLLSKLMDLTFCLKNNQDFRSKNTDLMRQDIVGVLKNSNQAFVRELVGIDPVAVFRWAIVRAYFRAVQAFKAAGTTYKNSTQSK